MRLDPVHWPARLQGTALLLVFVLYVLASVVGPRGGTEVSGWYAIAPALFGALSWRCRGVPWRDIASWTIPLLVWMAAFVIARPGPLLGVGGLVVGSAWLALFVCVSPLVPWWYRVVLRKSPKGPRPATGIDRPASGR